MKKVITKMLAFAAVLLCGGAWAAAPVAIWTDFTGADADAGITKGAFTLKANGNALAADGSSITIASDNNAKGVLIDFDTSRFSGYATVLVKYSGFEAPSSDAIAVSYKAANNNNLDLLGAAVKASTGKLINIWSQETNGNACEKAMPESGYIAVTLAGQGANNTKGATSLVKSAKDSSYQAAHSGLGVFTTTTTINGCSIGGRRHASGLASIPGMKIEAVAVFNAVLTAEDLAGFTFEDNLLYRFHLDGTKDNDGGIGNLTLTKGGSTDEANFYENGGALDTLKCYKGNGANQGYILGDGSTAIATFEQGWTLSWWVKPNNLQNWRDVCGFHIGATGYKLEKNASNQLQIYNNSTIASLTTPIPYTANNAANWIHVALVSNNDGESVSLYANGTKLQDISPNGATKLWGNSAIHGLTKVAIGVNGLYNINGAALNGMVDEVAIYNFAASADFVSTLASQIPPTRADLQVWKGESGDHKWNTAANWGLGVPTWIDDITIAAEHTVELDKVVAPKSLTVNGTVKGVGTIDTAITFANDATINVTDNAEGKALTLADGATIDFGISLKLVGATDGAVIVKNATVDQVLLKAITLTVDGEASEGYLHIVDGNIVYKATNDDVYWTPNPAKKDANGIVEWTAEDAWLNGTTPATWPKDDEEASRAIKVKFDPETGVTGIAITGPVYVGEVNLVNTGASSNQFDFHNSTKDVDGEHEITGGDTHDCLTADAINMLTYDGRLGLKVPIVGILTFGDNTKLVFKTAANGAQSASTAYVYTLGGRDTVIAVEGDGEFAIPAGMYGKDFASTVTSAGTPTVVVNSAAEVTGTISGDGKVKVAANATISGVISCTGGLDVGANTVTINVAEGERTISTPITGTGLIKKTGAGTLVVSGNNGNFTGSWEVVGGTLKRGSDAQLCFGPNSDDNTPETTIKVDAGATLDVNGLANVTYAVVLNGGTLHNGGSTIDAGHKQIVNITLEADSYVTGVNTYGMVPPGHGGSATTKGTLDLGGHILHVNMNSGKEFMIDGLADTESGGTIRVERGILLTASSHNSADLSHSKVELAGGSITMHKLLTVKDVTVTTTTTSNSGLIKVLGNIEGKTFMMPNVTLGADALVKTVNDKGLNVTTALTLEGALRVSVYGATERNTYVAVTAPNAALTAATIKMIGQDGAEVPNACATAIVENDFVVMRKLGGVSYVGMRSGQLPGDFTPIAIFDEEYTTEDITKKLYVTSKSADGSFSNGKKYVPMLIASNKLADGIRKIQLQLLDGYLKAINVQVKAVSVAGGKTVIMAKKESSGYIGNGTESTVEESYGTKLESWTDNSAYQTTSFTVGAIDADDFKFDAALNTLTGWFSSWSGSAFEDADKVIGPNGKTAYASKNDHHPYNTININGKDVYTISIYGRVDDVAVEGDNNGIIFAAGNIDNGESVVLAKKANGSVALITTGDNGGSIQSEVLQAGYHLFTIVKEQGCVYSLYVDGNQIGASTRWKSFSHGGDVQLASIPGSTSKDGFTNGDNADYAMILGFDAALEADNIAELAKKYPYVDTSAVTEMTVSDLNRAGTMFINSNATLTFDTDIANGCAVANLSGETVKLTLTTSGDKKFVSAADIKKLQLDANIKLDYGWTAHRVISMNFNSGNSSSSDYYMSGDTVDGTLGGKIKRSTWNNLNVDNQSTAVSISMGALNGETEYTVNGLVASWSCRGHYQTDRATTIPFMKGYLDDANYNKTPNAVNLTGIPFKTYDIIVYCQSDGANHFAPIKLVQGSDEKTYRFATDGTVEETTSTDTWGTGDQSEFAYEVTAIRIPGISGRSLTITSNKATNTSRSCFAAIQIVQMSTDEEDAALANAVAFIGEEPYATLEAAITAAGENETIIDLVKTSDETVAIPANVTVVPATTSCKLSGSITGEGTIKLVWNEQNAQPNVWFTTFFGESTLNGFTGTLNLAKSRFQSNTTIPSGIKLNITNGAQLWLTGGDAWANAITISGYGWSGTSGIEATKIRLNGGCEISGDITAEVIDDVIPVIGTHNQGAVASYSGAISGSFKTYGGLNSTVVLSATKLSGATAIEVTEGTLELGASEDATVSVVISGTGKVKKTGSAALTLSGANTFTGGLTIAAGTVKAGVGGAGSTSSAVGTGTVIVGANGTFDVNGQVFDTNGNGYTIQSAGTLKNGGSTLYANRRVIKRLELTGDTTIATGERFGMGIVDGGNSGDQKSYIVMNGHTLNIDTSTYFNLQNTEITGGGEIVVKQGAFLGYGKACSYDGTLKTTGTGKLELNNDCTLTFTVQNFELGSDQGVAGSGDLKVNGTLSTAANHNYSVPRLIMGDGATIKLANSQRVSATTKFEIGDHLNIDCSAVTDATFDAIEVPAAFHNADNWETNKAKLKSWIGSDYKVGTYKFANGNWLRILFGTEPQTKPAEVVTTEGGTTIENVVLPMSITETGKTNQTAANGEMKVWEAYVLGLDHTSATSKPIVSSAQTAEAGSIKLVDNLTPKTDVGVNVTRKLFVGTAPGSMSEVQDASYDNGFTVDVPTRDDKVKYLKIKYDFAAPQPQ